MIADPIQASPSNGPGLVEEVAAAARRLAGSAGPGAVGVGVPGLVDSAGTVRFAPNLPGLVGTPVTEALAEACPVGRSGSATTPPPPAGASTLGAQPAARTRCWWSPSGPASGGASSPAGG